MNLLYSLMVIGYIFPVLSEMCNLCEEVIHFIVWMYLEEVFLFGEFNVPNHSNYISFRFVELGIVWNNVCMIELLLSLRFF